MTQREYIKGLYMALDPIGRIIVNDTMTYNDILPMESFDEVMDGKSAMEIVCSLDKCFDINDNFFRFNKIKDRYESTSDPDLWLNVEGVVDAIILDGLPVEMVGSKDMDESTAKVAREVATYAWLTDEEGDRFIEWAVANKTDQEVICTNWTKLVREWRDAERRRAERVDRLAHEHRTEEEAVGVLSQFDMTAIQVDCSSDDEILQYMAVLNM